MKRSHTIYLSVTVLVIIALMGCAGTGTAKRGASASGEVSGEVSGNASGKGAGNVSGKGGQASESSGKVIYGIDALIADISKKSLAILGKKAGTASSKDNAPAGSGKEGARNALAVYYFTVSGASGKESFESGISDYLINGITSSLAGKSGIKIVSRKILDRVLEESAFQMSDLANKEAQIDVGKLAGADLILTGFITRGKDVNKLNVQIIRVETGVVIGGFIESFRLEPDFEKRIASSKSELIIERAGEVSEEGVATVTRIFATFNETVMNVQLSNHEEYWGNKIRQAHGEISREEKGGVDDSPFAVYSFEANIDSSGIYSNNDSNREDGWRDSDLNFNLIIDPNRNLSDYSGISFSAKPEGYTKAYLILNQEVPGGNTLSFSIPLYLNDGKWNLYKIPFASFQPDDAGTRINPKLPTRITLSVPFLENYFMYHFRSGDSIGGRLGVDNVGFYKVKEAGRVKEGLIDGFNNEVSGIVFSGEIAEASYYTDYSESDEGIVKRTPGIRNATLSIERSSGGVAGNYLKVSGHLNVTKDFVAFLDSNEDLHVVLRGSLGKSFKGFKTLQFYVKSDGASEGLIDYTDVDNNLDYSSDFRVSGIWGKVRIPFSKLVSEEGTLAEEQNQGSHIVFTFMFPLRKKVLRRGVEKGSIDFEIGLDEFLLE